MSEKSFCSSYNFTESHIGAFTFTYRKTISDFLYTVYTNFTNLKRLHRKQNHAIRIVHYKDKFERIRHLFRLNKMLNLY